MKAPRDKYYNDSQYRALVDMMYAHIHACHYTPSEMREAAVLACILYEEHHIRPIVMPLSKDVEDALSKIHEWTTSYEESLYQEKRSP